MNIKFIDENTVKIEVSIQWRTPRPPMDDRRVIKKDVYIDKFRKEHPRYRIEKVEGPAAIYNFRGKEQSKGVWILTVSKREKIAIPRKVAAPPERREDPKREERRPPDPRRRIKRRIIKTKKGD